MGALRSTILGTWRHSTLPLALHSPRGSPRSVQGNTMLPGRRRWQPRACLVAGATNWGLPRLRVPKTRTGNRHVGVPAQRLCSRPGDAGPGELPRLLVPPQLPLPTFSGTRPAGGFGILTISEPVLCQELPLANLRPLHSEAPENEALEAIAPSTQSLGRKPQCGPRVGRLGRRAEGHWTHRRHRCGRKHPTLPNL